MEVVVKCLICMFNIWLSPQASITVIQSCEWIYICKPRGVPTFKLKFVDHTDTQNTSAISIPIHMDIRYELENKNLVYSKSLRAV